MSSWYGRTLQPPNDCDGSGVCRDEDGEPLCDADDEGDTEPEAVVDDDDDGDCDRDPDGDCECDADADGDADVEAEGEAVTDESGGTASVAAWRAARDDVGAPCGRRTAGPAAAFATAGKVAATG